MKQYNVTGMSCAACQARVEKAVSGVPGVTSCAVSLLTNSMGVEGDASDEAVIKAVTDAGYGASLKGTQKGSAVADDSALEDRETPRMLKRLIVSAVICLALMYFSMGHMMWGWPVPAWFEGNHVAMGLVQLLLSGLVMVINQKFFINGFKGLIHRSPNMDTLVAMGSMTSFIWSTVVLFLMTKAVLQQDDSLVMTYMNQFYFESAAMILVLITVGKTLESYSKGRTTDALKSLMKLAPKTATLIRDGQESIVDIADVRVGDRFAVKPGESIPVDGVVIQGASAVDESALTGESVPVDKAEGDSVSAATINSSGYLVCEAVRVGEDTTLSRIIQMVSDAAATKAPIAKTADRVSGVFVPVVIGIAAVTFVIWMLVGQELSFALARAISVLVISCPCALGLATPVAIMVGSGVGAKNGILFKTAASLETAGKTQIVVLDKTGTITAGSPVVTDIVPAQGTTEDELLTAAASLEKYSEHPLAGAVTAYADDRNVSLYEVQDFKTIPGNGLKGRTDAGELAGGSLAYIGSLVRIPDEMKTRADGLASSGKTPLLFAGDGRLLGIIAVADVIKQDSPEAVADLRKMGIRVIMLTGDNERTAAAIAEEAGVDDFIAGVMPDGKETVVRMLRAYGRVTMIGDGINDAPALTRADVGIAIGAGTDVAIDAADIVLMNSGLKDAAAAVRLSRRTLTNIYENLFWAFFYNCIGIPLAAGAYIHLFGWTLNPMFGAAAMSLSSFFVVTNALRLNLVKIYAKEHDRRHRDEIPMPDLSEIKKTLQKEEKKDMTIKVEGMMCHHCEAHVKEALEALPFVETAVADHEANQVVLTLSGDADEAAIGAAVTKAGYDYKGIA